MVRGKGTEASGVGRPSLSKLVRPRRLGLRLWETRRGKITFELGRLSGLASLTNTESLGRRLGVVSRECLER